MIKDHIGKLLTDPTQKSNSLNSYICVYFSCERNNPQILSTKPGKPFIIVLKLQESDYQQSKKEMHRTRWYSWGNFKVRQGSHDPIPREIAGYYDEQ